jgi:hypothetical protein
LEDFVTQDSRKTPSESETPRAERRPWTRPVLTAYGPIGKLTQGGSGAKNDGSSGKKC